MKRPLHIGSLFDGIGGFPLVSMRVGADPLWASEIAPFPMSVTKMRFPQMTQMGDVTQLNGATLEPVEILCGGSPCQDLSVAGSRAGLSGSRSSLFMDQIRIAKEMRYEDMRRGRPALLIRPRWFCWENVPGVFSSGTPKYEDFRLVLEAVAGIVCHSISIPGPYPWSWQYAGRTDMGVEFSMAWRVLDAQYWSSTPQRRRRVFLVADFSGHTAAKILLSRRACRGVLRRMVKRGKPQPFSLVLALVIQGALIPRNRVPELLSLILSAQENEETCMILDHGEEDDASENHRVFAAGFSAGAGASAGSIGYSEQVAPTLKGSPSGNCMPSVLCLNDQGGDIMECSVNISGTLRAQEHGHQPLVFEITGLMSATEARCLFPLHWRQEQEREETTSRLLNSPGPWISQITVPHSVCRDQIAMIRRMSHQRSVPGSIKDQRTWFCSPTRKKWMNC